MSPTRLSKMEAGMRAALAYKDAFNRRDVDGIMALMDDDCLVEPFAPAPDGGVITGKDAIASFWEDFFAERDQTRLDIEDIFGMGLHCIMRWKLAWVDAAGEGQYLRGVDVFDVKDGLITEMRSYVKGG